MKRICLVYPNGMELPRYFRCATNISTDTIETLPPMGLLYIIGNSKRQIDFIDNRIKKHAFERLCQILMQYDVVGTIFEIKEARRLSAHLIKNGKTTFYGGPNATVNWRLYLGQFSVIWRGEAELMFDKAIENIENLDQVGFTRIAGSYVNLDTFRVKDLDSLSFPDRTKIKLDDYRRQEFHFLGNFTTNRRRLIEFCEKVKRSRQILWLQSNLWLTACVFSVTARHRRRSSIM